MERVYAAIDLKSFFASVECRKRNLDPLTTNLVVADNTRTEKTICLAISPSLKVYGLPGRARLFEVVQKVKNINNDRKRWAFQNIFTGKSYDDIELKQNKNLELDYIIAPPHMASYMEYSAKIYNIYLKYVSPEDIFPYSIDEIFCDLTSYLNTYKLTPRELVTKIIHNVYETTGITATAGIGTNLFLCKVAMDVMAKHVDPDKYGVRIAELDEKSFREKLWNHRPITDFWRVGKGYAKRLEKYRMFTMGDVARCSVDNEELLYKLFGVNAELLIDHSWGWECATIKSIKECKPAVIKGNGSEIRAIAGAAFHGTGVDVSAADAVTAKDPDTVHSMAHIARKLAEETGAVILVTGEVDIIASPNKDTTYGIYNGSPNMAKVTGTGCMLTCITGTYLAVTDALTACILAAITLDCAGECANAAKGLGTYHIELINQLSVMNEDQITQLSNIQRLL